MRKMKCLKLLRKKCKININIWEPYDKDTYLLVIDFVSSNNFKRVIDSCYSGFRSPNLPSG